MIREKKRNVDDKYKWRIKSERVRDEEKENNKHGNNREENIRIGGKTKYKK